jgi:hypothetical protein
MPPPSRQQDRSDPRRYRAVGPLWILVLILQLWQGPGVALASVDDGGPEYYRAVAAFLGASAATEWSATAASPGAIDRGLSARFGWTRVSTMPAARAVSGASSLSGSASHVSLPTPAVYYNSQLRRYEAVARWSWRTCEASSCVCKPNLSCVIDDGCLSGDCGGVDGFGVSISKEVNDKASYLATYEPDGDLDIFSVPADQDGWGATYREQDSFHGFFAGYDYDWHHGTLFYAFTLVSCAQGERFVLRTRMGHTWDRTAVSGISVGRNGISISFSAEEHRWDAASPTPLVWIPCRA